MEYKSVSLKPRKADLMIIAFALMMALAVIMFFADNDGSKTAVILKDGKEITRIDLNTTQEREIKVEGEYINTILVKDGSIGVIHSDCPGEVCVSSGMMSDAGRSIVCLPNRMEIRITGSSDVDIVVG